MSTTTPPSDSANGTPQQLSDGLAVTTTGLTKYYGGKAALDGLDLEVPSGSVFGLLGPNGAGKTTTFGLLCGFLRPNQGSAKVLGVPLSGLGRLRGEVAMLPQDSDFPDTLSVIARLQHLAMLQGFNRRQAHKQAREALDLVGLSRADSHKPAGAMSYGMKKKAALAQVVVSGPRLAILDEPTSGLDPESRRQVKDLILTLSKEATVVLSSHNLPDVQELCSHGAIIRGGKITEIGTIEALTQSRAQITIEVGLSDNREAQITADALNDLRRAFGEHNVTTQSHLMTISFDGDEPTEEITRAALSILLDHEVPILGLRRGTSLERAYLDRA